jgi:hypothetical protein
MPTISDAAKPNMSTRLSILTASIRGRSGGLSASSARVPAAASRIPAAPPASAMSALSTSV